MSKSHTTKPPVPAIVNRRARFDYELSDDIVVGISLTGLEVRAAREGHVQLKGAYVTIRNSELWLTAPQRAGSTKRSDSQHRRT